MVAQQVSGLGERVSRLEQRMLAVEKVNARLEAAALTTARVLTDISPHWDAVYEAMKPGQDDLDTERQLPRERNGPALMQARG